MGKNTELNKLLHKYNLKLIIKAESYVGDEQNLYSFVLYRQDDEWGEMDYEDYSYHHSIDETIDAVIDFIKETPWN